MLRKSRKALMSKTYRWSRHK